MLFHMNKAQADEEITTDAAKDVLGITTREGVVQLITRKKLKARKLEPHKRNSPWLIKRGDLAALLKERKEKKRAQASSA